MANKTYGYARVSDKNGSQLLERQLKSLRDYGIDERDIITDKQSGKTFNREGYKALTETLLREGDTLVIYSIDRLGRNYTEIQKQWERLTKEIKVNIKVLDMPLLDTTADTNNLEKTFIADLVLQILSYVAEKERLNTKARQESAYNAMPRDNKDRIVSLRTGKPVGRPETQYPTNWKEVYTSWKNGEITAVKAMTELNMTKATFYRMVKRYEEQ